MHFLGGGATLFTETAPCAYSNHVSRNNHQFGWQQWAACNGVPSYIFFGDERRAADFRSNPQYEGKTAADFCNTCKVRFLCEEFADLHDLQGTWGGKSEIQRNQLATSDEIKELRLFRKNRGEYWPLYGHAD